MELVGNTCTCTTVRELAADFFSVISLLKPILWFNWEMKVQNIALKIVWILRSGSNRLSVHIHEAVDAPRCSSGCGTAGHISCLFVYENDFLDIVKGDFLQKKEGAYVPK